jgi:hypothetical protein
VIVLSERAICYVSSQKNAAASGSQQVADKNVGKADRPIHTYLETIPSKMRGLCCQFAGLYLVYIAPHPSLSGFRGSHKRMFGSLKVLPCMPVR